MDAIVVVKIRVNNACEPRDVTPDCTFDAIVRDLIKFEGICACDLGKSEVEILSVEEAL